MKRVLSLIMVVGMLLGVLALASCGDEPVETTTEATTTAATTTEATTTATEATTTATEATTTATEATTTATEATTTATEATTTATEETTSATEATTTESQVAEITTGETLPAYTRLDFGTNSRVHQENLANGVDLHQWIVDTMTYNSTYVDVKYTEDTMIVYALKDYSTDLVDTASAYALYFADIVSYDFADDLVSGYGTWSAAPYVDPTATTGWVGRHQYMQIRCKNNSTNNMMSVEFAKTVGGFATTTMAPCMYLQAGAPTTTTDLKRSASAAMSDFATFTYDMNFLAHCGRNWAGDYASMVAAVLQNPNGCGSNNWVWFGGASVVSLRFHVLGAYSSTYSSSGRAEYFSASHLARDSREFIKEGNSIEIDYIIFGSTPEQLDAWKSISEGYKMPAAESTEAAA